MLRGDTIIIIVARGGWVIHDQPYPPVFGCKKRFDAHVRQRGGLKSFDKAVSSGVFRC